MYGVCVCVCVCLVCVCVWGVCVCVHIMGVHVIDLMSYITSGFYGSGSRRSHDV